MYKRQSLRYNTSNHLNGDASNKSNNGGAEIADEQFWADNYEKREENHANDDNDEDGDVRELEMDNPFDDGIDFNQAFEDNDDDENADDVGHSPPSINEENDKFLPKDNKINYSRVAKRVDVRRLKKNIWNSIQMLVAKRKEEEKENEDTNVINFKFTEISQEISGKYLSLIHI